LDESAATTPASRPVLDWDEAPAHPHNAARNTFVAIDGVTQPAPVPRFSRTQPSPPRSARVSGDDTGEILRKWGVEESSIGKLPA
jgi:alpha-methylacyl-CoA racemase